MSTSLDEFSPWYLSERRIELSLHESNEPALYAHRPVVIAYDISACEPEGVMGPFVLKVSGPSPSGYIERTYERLEHPGFADGKKLLPTIIFTPREGGPHLVTLGELAHNYWWGRIHLNIEGPTLERPKFL